MTDNASGATARPWSISEARIIVREVPGMCDAGDYYAVAETHFHSLLSYEEAKANALLIVKAVNGYDAAQARIRVLEDQVEALDGDARWAINVLLEQIAAKFDAWETMDLWRSDAAITVRSFKHDLSPITPRVRDWTPQPIAWAMRLPTGGSFQELTASRTVMKQREAAGYIIVPLYEANP